MDDPLLSDSSTSDDQITSPIPQQPISFFQMFVLLSNFTIGVGFLSFPFVFAQIGLRLGILVTLLFSFVCFLSYKFLAETMSRVDIVLDLEQDLFTNMVRLCRPKFESSSKQYEVPELVEVFIGKQWKFFYQVLLIFSLTSGLICFCSAAAGTLTTFFVLPLVTEPDHCFMTTTNWLSDCKLAYRFYLVVFIAFVTFLSSKEVSCQSKFQVYLYFFRIVTVFLCCLTVIVESTRHPFVPPSDPPPRPTGSTLQYLDWNFSQLASVFPLIFFAFFSHHCIPSLVASLKDKLATKSVLAYSSICTSLLYLLFGSVCFLYFRNSSGPVVTLLWRFFPWDSPSRNPNLTIFQHILTSLIFIQVPVICVSAYPLHANVLKNVVFDVFFPREKKKDLEIKTLVFVAKLCLFSTTLIPFIIAFYFDHTYNITLIHTITGLIVSFIFPALLHLASREKCISIWNSNVSNQNSLTSVFSRPIFAYFTIFFSIFVIIFCVLNSLNSGIFRIIFCLGCRSYSEL
ncbi:hypothetical protein RCL1_000744 [Eukaryota sp. TZLM3-RCL]